MKKPTAVKVKGSTSQWRFGSQMRMESGWVELWREKVLRWTDHVQVSFSGSMFRLSRTVIWVSVLTLSLYRPYNLPVRYRGLFSKFSTLMRYFSGRPHWAKSHDLTPKDFEKLLPHWNDFKETREWADPEGVFENPYIRRHLKGEISEDDGQRRFKSRLWRSGFHLL